MLDGLKPYLYVFKRTVPLEGGPLADRESYFVYAPTRSEAFRKFNEAHVEEIKAGFKPILLRRETW